MCQDVTRLEEILGVPVENLPLDRPAGDQAAEQRERRRPDAAGALSLRVGAVAAEH